MYVRRPTLRVLEETQYDPTDMPVDQARAAYRAHRVAEGWADTPGARLLTWPDENVKLDKTDDYVVGLSLAPHRDGGRATVCVSSTKECRRGCLTYAGKGGISSVQLGRATKTRFLFDHPQAFITLLWHELQLAVERVDGPVFARLNVLSDVKWELLAPKLFELPIQFYDYTKRTDRIIGQTPPNFHLTYSVSEMDSDLEAFEQVLLGTNVAIVFDTPKGKPLPPTWHGLPVIDGDEDDNRTRDPVGCVVGLRAKGRMRQGRWSMVRSVAVELLPV